MEIQTKTSNGLTEFFILSANKKLRVGPFFSFAEARQAFMELQVKEKALKVKHLEELNDLFKPEPIVSYWNTPVEELSAKEYDKLIKKSKKVTNDTKKEI